MTDWPQYTRSIDSGARALGISLSDEQLALLVTYLRELASWNATHNLTAIREPEAMVTRHLLDCLAIDAYIDGTRVADVGTGPGLPGFVLAVVDPARRITLVETNRKKTMFLRHARRQLGLAHVEIVQSRVEDYRPDDPFDCVVTRAFASAANTIDQCAHLLAPEGRFVLMKGRDSSAETACLPAGFRLVDTAPIHVPGLDAARHVAIVARG